jgi:NO-binding membrane sensor protein with MHYT domain
MRHRVGFFLFAAVAVAALWPVAVPEHRRIVVAVAAVYCVFAALTALDYASRVRRDSQSPSSSANNDAQV